MKPNPLKQQKLFKLIALYFFMAVAVISIVFVIFMFVLGYRIDNTNGQIEQYSFFQFNSSPVGATVTVDGLPVNAQTPNKVSLPAGTHNVVMKKDNYQDWTKSVSVKAATLTWLNYAIL
ncbi:MAG: PEGA domain-containing protein, partial [Ignavibacteria bacterium]|nr:PEGA domain-containing protein [Ignavibacteria bacterium]